MQFDSNFDLESNMEDEPYETEQLAEDLQGFIDDAMEDPEVVTLLG